MSKQTDLPVSYRRYFWKQGIQVFFFVLTPHHLMKPVVMQFFRRRKGKTTGELLIDRRDTPHRKISNKLSAFRAAGLHAET